jgi:hypothetical protein
MRFILATLAGALVSTPAAAVSLARPLWQKQLVSS